ncbi:MAG: AmmeMemoRadiSam system protein B [bacterium]|nr:AmmeMemoRadiSam system protein B [bacterium]
MMKTKILFYFMIFTAIIFLNLFIRETDAKMIRKPAVAGQFYPDGKEELIKMVDEFLAKANPVKPAGELLGLISPHAGYVYSGQVAAYSYKLIKDTKYDVVIILGGSHIMPFNYGSIYYKNGDDNYFLTPLGEVKINKSIAETLLKNDKIFKADMLPHINEHSIEVQIPFLQRVLKPGFEIIPIVFGTQSYEILESAAEIIYNAIKDKNVLLIASTDLSHYYDYKTAQKMDNIGIEAIKTLDPLALIKPAMHNETQLCGLSGVLVEMIVTKKMGANNVQVLNMANSGDVPAGDKNKVVGYSAIAITKK